ncbi:MAG: hypothetical protein QXO51_06230 [Halobacteria archaeon]
MMETAWIGLALAIPLMAYVERRHFSLGTFLRRRLNNPHESPSCLVVRDSPGDLREAFRFMAGRIGGRADFDHLFQTIDRNDHGRQVLSCRIRDGRNQYHFRVMPVPLGYAVTGHYEPLPGRHPLKHYLGIGTDLVRACADFRKFYDEWRSTQFHI